MSSSALVSAVRAIDWGQLESTYSSGEVVRDIILGLASRNDAQARAAWRQMCETVLQHQGTVYPATAAAAPFLCQIALDTSSPWREALTADLAVMSTGHDEPFAPAGTARAVRDAIRPYVEQLLRQWGIADPGLHLALIMLSVAFPVEAAAITGQLREWFTWSDPPLRTVLGLALGFHGLADEAVRQIIADEVDQSNQWAAHVSSPVPEAIQVAERLRAGTEEQTSDFAPVLSFLLIIAEHGHGLIDYPN